jgi:hypothetical protein
MARVGRVQDLFKGFVVLRFVGLFALLVVAGVILGISLIGRGSDVAGIAILACAVVLAAGIASLVARRISGRHR